MVRYTSSSKLDRGRDMRSVERKRKRVDRARGMGGDFKAIDHEKGYMMSKRHGRYNVKDLQSHANNLFQIHNKMIHP